MLLFSKFTISGHSMEPHILSGKSVFVSSIPYFFIKPKVGDVIAIKNNGKVLIKRISKINFQKGKSKYFVKGDNVSDSLDSRVFGWIDVNKIMGKIVLVI